MTEKPKFKSLEVCLSIIIVVGLIISLSLWQYVESKNRALSHARLQNIKNSKQIGLALFEFEQDYGTYPNSETAKEITDTFPNHGYDLTGNSSNALFRQLLASGIAPSEDIFYAKTRTSKKPDGNTAPGEALKKGEVGFAYISGLSTAGNPSRILLIGPAIPGTTKFDPKPFDGLAFVLHVDQSVAFYKIKKDGNIPDHPIWNGKTPTIHYPE